MKLRKLCLEKVPSSPTTTTDGAMSGTKMPDWSCTRDISNCWAHSSKFSKADRTVKLVDKKTIFVLKDMGL